MAKKSQLTVHEREQIMKLISQGFSQNLIAKTIGKHQSTISREIRRDGMNQSCYSIAKAQVDCNRKAGLRGSKKKLIEGGKLLNTVKDKLVNFRWSPEQISGYLNKDHRSKQVSYETIYRYIYSIKDQNERALWINSLRQKQKKRRSRKGKTEKRGKIPNRVSIHARPIEVEERIEGGHWEGDLIIGKDHASAIGTLVERTSRFVIIIKLPIQRTSEIVVNEFAKELMNIPPNLRKSLTYDNGHEMSRHELLTKLTGMEVFFADPGFPGQRGSNENTNGLVRDIYPKGTDFNTVSREELKKTQTLINQRPRKVLDYGTPEQVLKRMIKESDPPDKHKHRPGSGERVAVTLS